MFQPTASLPSILVLPALISWRKNIIGPPWVKFLLLVQSAMIKGIGLPMKTLAKTAQCYASWHQFSESRAPVWVDLTVVQTIMDLLCA